MTSPERNFLLGTARLVMLPLAPDDLDATHRLWTEPGVRRYLWDDQVISRQRAEEVIRQSLDSVAAEGFGLWAVRRKGEEGLCGFCGLGRFSSAREVELLFGLAPEHWGQGLATEAARAVLVHGFERVGLKRIIGRTDVPNVASARVMERLGMTYEGRVSENGVEMVQYALERGARSRR